jgi:hypothetical protein
MPGTIDERDRRPEENAAANEGGKTSTRVSFSTPALAGVTLTPGPEELISDEMSALLRARLRAAVLANRQRIA